MNQRAQSVKIVWLTMTAMPILLGILASSLPRPPTENALFIDLMFGFALLMLAFGKFVPKLLKNPNADAQIFLGHILRYALFESAGIFCFLAMITGGAPKLYGYAGLAIVVLSYLLHPPRAEL